MARTTPRFEAFVRERVVEMTSAERARLAKALEEEEARIAALKQKYYRVLVDGVAKTVEKLIADAKKNGVDVNEEYLRDAPAHITDLSRMSDFFGPRQYSERRERDDRYVRFWPKGSEARARQDALERFDDKVESAVRRIVVYKMDLGLKPDAFEDLLEKTVKSIFEG